MIQRIQSLYLLLAGVLMVVCLCNPVGRLVVDGRPETVMYNLWLVTPQGTHTFEPWALFAILVLATAATVLALLLFRKRMRQVRLCIFNCLLLIGYIVAYVIFAFILQARYEAEFSVCWAAALPVVALILTYLAFRAVMRDELLVRSLERLR